MAKEAKTNAMRILERQKIPYQVLTYECGEFIDGIHVADLTGTPRDQSYKTLIMEGKSRAYYVFVGSLMKKKWTERRQRRPWERNPWIWSM